MPNETISLMLQHRSVRKFTPGKLSNEILQTIVRAGQQAAFASQLYSLILSRKKNLPFHAAAMFTICFDMHRMELIMARRGWHTVSNNMMLLIFGMQDASLMAQNMILAAESLGLGTCLLGAAPSVAGKLKKLYHLPDRVFPLVQLVIGHPGENFPPRPRYPYEFTCFEDRYPELTDDEVEKAMQVMDEGYLAQGYYEKQRAMIPLEIDKKETFTYRNYSWTEHISRKWGQWHADINETLEQLEICGFPIRPAEK